jgi:hypothetical protein
MKKYLDKIIIVKNILEKINLIKIIFVMIVGIIMILPTLHESFDQVFLKSFFISPVVSFVFSVCIYSCFITRTDNI